jgi:hypothetical protein
MIDSIMSQFKKHWIAVEPYVLTLGFGGVLVYGIWSAWNATLLVFTK